MNLLRVNLLFLALSLVFLSSCKKEEDDSSTPAPSKLGTGVIVLNEGQFFANNASVLFRGDDGSTTADLFANKNGQPLGDVLQSITETESNYYLVVNSSGKIEVVDKNDFKSVSTISGLSSPRYMLDMGNGKALVSNLTLDTVNTANKLNVIDLNSNSSVSEISVSGTCEQMHMKNDIVYVANTDKNQILMINRNNLSISGTISTAPQPIEMVEDKFGFLWVLCRGDYQKNIAPALVRINTGTNKVEKKFDFSQGTFVSRLAINAGGGTLYIISDKVYYMPASASTLTLNPFNATASLSSPYGIGVDAETGHIYVGDAKDYSSKGQVHIYDATGNEVGSFQSGVNPNGFIFRD